MEPRRLRTYQRKFVTRGRNYAGVACSLHSRLLLQAKVSKRVLMDVGAKVNHPILNSYQAIFLRHRFLRGFCEAFRRYSGCLRLRFLHLMFEGDGEATDISKSSSSFEQQINCQGRAPKVDRVLEPYGSGPQLACVSTERAPQCGTSCNPLRLISLAPCLSDSFAALIPLTISAVPHHFLLTLSLLSTRCPLSPLSFWCTASLHN